MSDHDEKEFDFDSLQRAERFVRYRSKLYVLLEASEGAAVEYRNACARAARMTDGKVTGVDRVGDVQPLLVSLCLAETENDALKIDRQGNPVLVPLTTIKSWQAKVIKPLFNWIVEHSELSEDESEEALVKRLEQIQQKLDTLRQKRLAAGNGKPVPNEPATASPVTSD